METIEEKEIIDIKSLKSKEFNLRRMFPLDDYPIIELTPNLLKPPEEVDLTSNIGFLLVEPFIEGAAKSLIIAKKTHLRVLAVARNGSTKLTAHSEFPEEIQSELPKNFSPTFQKRAQTEGRGLTLKFDHRFLLLSIFVTNAGKVEHEFTMNLDPVTGAILPKTIKNRKKLKNNEIFVTNPANPLNLATQLHSQKKSELTRILPTQFSSEPLHTKRSLKYEALYLSKNLQNPYAFESFIIARRSIRGGSRDDQPGRVVMEHSIKKLLEKITRKEQDRFLNLIGKVVEKDHFSAASYKKNGFFKFDEKNYCLGSLLPKMAVFEMSNDLVCLVAKSMTFFSLFLYCVRRRKFIGVRSVNILDFLGDPLIKYFSKGKKSLEDVSELLDEDEEATTPEIDPGDEDGGEEAENPQNQVQGEGLRPGGPELLQFGALDRMNRAGRRNNQRRQTSWLTSQIGIKDLVVFEEGLGVVLKASLFSKNYIISIKSSTKRRPELSALDDSSELISCDVIRALNKNTLIFWFGRNQSAGVALVDRITLQTQKIFKNQNLVLSTPKAFLKQDFSYRRSRVTRSIEYDFQKIRGEPRAIFANFSTVSSLDLESGERDGWSVYNMALRMDTRILRVAGLMVLRENHLLMVIKPRVDEFEGEGADGSKEAGLRMEDLKIFEISNLVPGLVVLDRFGVNLNDFAVFELTNENVVFISSHFVLEDDLDTKQRSVKPIMYSIEINSENMTIAEVSILELNHFQIKSPNVNSIAFINDLVVFAGRSEEGKPALALCDKHLKILDKSQINENLSHHDILSFHADKIISFSKSLGVSLYLHKIDFEKKNLNFLRAIKLEISSTSCLYSLSPHIGSQQELSHLLFRYLDENRYLYKLISINSELGISRSSNFTGFQNTRNIQVVAKNRLIFGSFGGGSAKKGSYMRTVVQFSKRESVKVHKLRLLSDEDLGNVFTVQKDSINAFTGQSLLFYLF